MQLLNPYGIRGSFFRVSAALNLQFRGLPGGVLAFRAVRSLRLFTCALLLAGGLSLPAAGAWSQPIPAARIVAQATPAPTKSPSAYEVANWSKYLAWVLAGLGVAVLGMAGLGWLIQGPGFRKLDEEEE